MFENIKSKFPVFIKKPNLVFLDTAASALKVDDMIKAVNNCYSFEYSNIHRGVYDLSANLTEKFEGFLIKPDGSVHFGISLPPVETV